MKTFQIIPIAALAFFTVSCGGNNEHKEEKEEENIYEMTDKETGITSLTSFTDSASIDVLGKNYNYTIQFQANDTLPHFTTPQGADYLDNEAILTISNDTTVIMKKVFTKGSFKSYLPEKLKTNSGLASFAYNALRRELKENDAFYFIASIGNLDDQEEIPYCLEIRITPDGGMTIQKLSDSDTGPLHEGMSIEPKD